MPLLAATLPAGGRVEWRVWASVVSGIEAAAVRCMIKEVACMGVPAVLPVARTTFRSSDRSMVSNVVVNLGTPSLAARFGGWRRLPGGSCRLHVQLQLHFHFHFINVCALRQKRATSAGGNRSRVRCAWSAAHRCSFIMACVPPPGSHARRRLSHKQGRGIVRRRDVVSTEWKPLGPCAMRCDASERCGGSEVAVDA